jgi:hypothetical protein
VTLSEWWFKFQPSPDVAAAVRLLGAYGGQAWGSSTVIAYVYGVCLRLCSVEIVHDALAQT